MVPLRRIVTSKGIAVALLVVGSDVAAQVAPSGSWDDAAGTVEIVPDENTCSGCVAFTPLVQLGDNVGPGYIVESQWVATDGEGKYWVGQGDHIKVFAPDGRYRATVGRQGQGPAEFMVMAGMFADPEGRVHVMDLGNARESTFGPELELVAERRLFFSSMLSFAPFPDEDWIVVNGPVRTEASIGHPLHIVVNGAVEKSFGLASGTSRLGSAHTRRVLAVGHELIYAASTYEYAIEVWSREGEWIARIKRPELWTAPEEIAPMTPSNPDVLPLVAALKLDPLGRLWVVTWLPRPDARANLREVNRGGRTFLAWDQITDVYHSRVELLDLRARRVLATGTFDALIGGFLPEDRVHGPIYSDDGSPHVLIGTLQLAGSTPGEAVPSVAEESPHPAGESSN